MDMQKHIRSKYKIKNKGEIFIMKTKENLVSEAQIDEWKSQHGHVYKINIDGDIVIYRRLKRKEYFDLMIETDIDQEEENDSSKRAERLFNRQAGVCKLAILYPENAEELIENSAGLAIGLSEEIMARSGFNFVNESEEL